MRSNVVLDPFFARLWRDTDPFAEVERLEGEEFRRVKTRRTFRFELQGRGFFAKVHHGVGWREIFKNLLQWKRPVLGAENEFRALNFLHQLGVDTMTPCAFGLRGGNPAKLESFLITAELAGMVSLEDYCREWAENPPPFRRKKRLLRQVARMAGTMHRAGLNHRDCYICHFLLDLSTADDDVPRLYVIDLHRAEIRRRVPRRYLVKDVAGLYFSAMDAGLTWRDKLRFIRYYTNRPLRSMKKRFWRDVERAACALYRKEERKRK